MSRTRLRFPGQSRWAGSSATLDLSLYQALSIRASQLHHEVNTALGSLYIWRRAQDKWYMLTMLVAACRDAVQTMNLRQQNGDQAVALTRKSRPSDLMLAHASSKRRASFPSAFRRVVTAVSRADRLASFRSPSSQTASTRMVGSFFHIILLQRADIPVD
jgi:hypothetical protein